MKVTELEVGRKYRLPRWRERKYVYVVEIDGKKYLFNNNDDEYNLTLHEAYREDWEEYLEHGDYEK